MSELMDAFRDLVDANDDRSDCFLEIDVRCQVIQLGDLRITMAWPPSRTPTRSPSLAQDVWKSRPTSISG